MGDTLYSRNWAFIDAATQRLLNETTLLTAGTGLGSRLAVLAARTGFGRFILADGDVVERSNLNRQSFFAHHLGVNKAQATAEQLREVRDDLQVRVMAEYLTQDSLPQPIEIADIVINTIDFDDPVFLACNRIARERGRLVLLPMNLGWGAALYAFAPDSPTLEDVLADELASGGTDAIKVALVRKALGDTPHPYLREPLERFLNPGEGGWPSDPQLGVAASLASALAVTAAVAAVRRQPLRLFPEVSVLDAAVAVLASGGGEPCDG